MKRLSFMVLFLVICVALVFPATAQENPFLKAGDITPADVPAEISGDLVVTSDTSSVAFEGSGYTHKIGRVSISLQPLIEGLDKNPVSSGNIRTSGTGNTIKYEVYRDLIKETVTLNSPEKLVYSYDLGLSDWVTVEPDMSRPEINYDENKTEIVMYPHTKEVTNYAKESTIEIDIDPWGNLIVYVNGEDVVVMPRPFAVDASGKHFDLDFELDRNAGTITVAGDLEGAKYPVVIDPTERVTNGGFETGDKSGWTGSYYVVSDGPYEGTYCLYVYGIGGYTTLSQIIDYTGVSTVSNAVEFRQANTYDIPMSDAAIQGFNWLINAPGQYVQDWTVRSTTPCLSGTGNIIIWTYSSTRGYVDSVHAIATEPIAADFTGTPTSGDAPLTVQFTDTSTGSPTSWSWDFGDGGTSELQNPSYEYDTAGVYTVTLTAANCLGNDMEVKEDYVTVTIPPTAYNYDFYDFYGITTTPAAETAAAYQNQIGYSPFSQTNANALDAYNHLSDCSIFFFNGHGLTEGGIPFGGILFSDGKTIVGNNWTSSDEYAINLADDGLDNILLVVYDGCYTASESPFHGNLAEETKAKGADYVIGFSGHVGNDKSNYWGNEFWMRVKNGESIEEAAENARNEAFWNAWIPYTLDGLDTMEILGDDPENTYLQPARYGDV